LLSDFCYKKADVPWHSRAAQAISLFYSRAVAHTGSYDLTTILIFFVYLFWTVIYVLECLFTDGVVYFIIAYVVYAWYEVYSYLRQAANFRKIKQRDNALLITIQERFNFLFPRRGTMSPSEFKDFIALSETLNRHEATKRNHGLALAQLRYPIYDVFLSSLMCVFRNHSWILLIIAVRFSWLYLRILKLIFVNLFSFFSGSAPAS